MSQSTDPERVSKSKAERSSKSICLFGQWQSKRLMLESETIVVGLPMTVYRQQSFGVYAHPPPSLYLAMRGVRASGCFKSSLQKRKVWPLSPSFL